MEDKISIREYARRLSINEKAVRKAIAAGRIVRGFDAEAKKILPEAANEEWGHKHVIAKARPGVSREKVIEKLGATPAPVTTDTDDEVEEHELQGIDTDGADLTRIRIGLKTPVAEAMRIREVIGAGRDKLKLAEEQGRLVSKDKVEKALYALGSELKKALLNIPVRVVRDIMAATNEVEGINILTDEISAVLTTYGNLNKDTL